MFEMIARNRRFIAIVCIMPPVRDGGPIHRFSTFPHSGRGVPYRPIAPSPGGGEKMTRLKGRAARAAIALAALAALAMAGGAMHKF
jgi:hypothetical protein